MPTEEATEEPKNEDAVELAEGEEAKEEVSEAKEETVTPKKGRGRRSAGASPAKAETPPSSGRSSRNRTPKKLPEETPTRRSGRTRRSAGNEEEATPTKDDQEMETSAETAGQKRKREDDETDSKEKKQKIDEPEQKEESMDVDEPKTEEKESAAEAQADASKESTEEPEASKESKDDSQEQEAKLDDAEKTEEAVQDTTAGKPEVSTEAKEDAADYPSADEPDSKVETTPEEPKPMDTTPEPEEENKATASEVAQSNKKEPEPNMDDYVVVNKDEVPPADSAEVVDALPKEAEVKEANESTAEVEEAAQSSNANESEPTSQPVSVIQEPVSSQPDPPATATPVESSERPTENGEDDTKCGTNATMDTNDVPVQEPSKDMAAPSNNIDSVAQEPSATIPNPLFQRLYVANPKIDSTLAADVARKFSVVSYNILADCHAPLSKYPWITPDHLSQEYRNKKLLQELQYLDADIVCLQEVGPEYFENTLKPTMGA